MKSVVFIGPLAAMAALTAHAQSDPATAAAASPTPLRALVRGCPAAKRYPLDAMKRQFPAPSQAERVEFAGTTSATRGPYYPDPAPADADIRLRGIIGASMMQTLPYATATTLWRTQDGRWHISAVDHKAGGPPPPPAPPPPEAFVRDHPEYRYGFVDVPSEQGLRARYRVTEGLLTDAAGSTLDTLLADPCLALEIDGLTDAKPKPPVICPPDTAGWTIEITRGGRRRYLGISCNDALPDGRLANILFYPSTPQGTPGWPDEGCDACRRLLPLTTLFRTPLTTGDDATDARLRAAHALLDAGNATAALGAFEGIARGPDAPAKGWVALPEIAYLRAILGQSDEVVAATRALRLAQSFLDYPDSCAAGRDLKGFSADLLSWQASFCRDGGNAIRALKLTPDQQHLFDAQQKAAFMVQSGVDRWRASGQAVTP